MRICLLIVIVILAGSCKNKRSLAGEDKVAVNDFIEAFTTTKLPYTIIDTGVSNTITTDTISHSVFTQFVPDSVLNNLFGKERRLSIQPMARLGEKTKETYLSILVKSRSKSVVYLLAFTQKGIFSASLPLLVTGKQSKWRNSATVDARLAVSIQKEWTNENELLFSRTIYAYNNAGIFSVVMTETNDQSGVANDINNPLDTLPRNNKYSGDYFKSKTNFLTIRDGKTPGSYLFFVHFENNTDEACNGEVKGEFIIKAPGAGVFTEAGDPCVIDFNFEGDKVKVKEQGSCGSHRGIKCYFNDTYVKKKESKAAKNRLVKNNR